MPSEIKMASDPMKIKDIEILCTIKEDTVLYKKEV